MPQKAKHSNPLNLYLSDIGRGGRKLNLVVDQATLKEALQPDDSMNAAITTAAEVNLAAERLGNNVSLKGELELELHPDCDRCLENYRLPFKHAFQVTCMPDKTLNEEDEGAFPFSGDMIDLAEVIRGQLFANLPMVFHCSEQCQGLCPSCGSNLNTEPCSCKQAALN